MRDRGFSLIETVLAMFLLVAEVLVLMSSFQQGLRNQARSAMAIRGVAAVERTLAEIRAWSRQPANFDGNWSAYAGLTRTDPDDPALQVQVECQPNGQPLYSPCQPLEGAWAAQALLLPRSAVAVRVTAIWDPSYANGRVSATSYIGQPTRAANPLLQLVQSGGATSPVPPDAVMSFQVSAQDSSGQPLTDLHYFWSVKPFTGNATVLPGGPRDGTRVDIKHIYNSNGQSLHVAGIIQVQCRAVYHGQELKAASGDILLQ